VSARVVVVERSPLVAELTVRALREAGHQVTHARDEATLERALALAQDVVVLDPAQAFGFAANLPGRLKALPLPPRLLLCAAHPEAELARLAAETGAEGYAPAAPGGGPLLAELQRLVPPAARQRRLLLVDDSEATTWLLAQALADKGFQVHTAASAEEATKLLLKKDTRPDLVLLDVQMPNINGEQFCRFIKGNALFAGIRVLLCSGADAAELQRICRDAGADGYLPKDEVLSRLGADGA
jgi:CheY-like chemotaxis protein